MTTNCVSYITEFLQQEVQWKQLLEVSMIFNSGKCLFKTYLTALNCPWDEFWFINYFVSKLGHFLKSWSKKGSLYLIFCYFDSGYSFFRPIGCMKHLFWPENNTNKGIYMGFNNQVLVRKTYGIVCFLYYKFKNSYIRRLLSKSEHRVSE